MNKDKIEIIEKEQTYQDSSLTQKQIVLKHIDRISKYIFTGEQEPTTKLSGKEIVKTQDRRVIIIQAIDFLVAILSTHYDPKMKTSQDKFDKVMENVEKGLINNSINTEAYNQAIKREGELQENITTFKNLFLKNSIIPINKQSSYYERYLNMKYSNYMKLFEEQNNLLNRINYLDGTSEGSEE